MHLDPRWLDPDGVEHILIDYRGRGRFGCTGLD